MLVVKSVSFTIIWCKNRAECNNQTWRKYKISMALGSWE